MESRFSVVFFACCASWFKNNYFVSKFWPQHGGSLGVSEDIFGNYDVPYEEESRVTWSKQCNIWRRTISIRMDLSTGTRTNTTWRRRRKKRFTRTCTCGEYGLVNLKKMYFQDERRWVLSLPGAGRSEWEVRFFRIVFKLFFVQKLNYLELYGKLTFPAFLF